MKFVYTGGTYTQFMGRMFAFGNPVEVADKATIAALQKRKDFKEVADGPQEAAPAPAVLKQQRPVLRARGK